jgi:single-stranded-DNA-specific exonuclease
VLGALAPGGCTAELVERIETAGPFGPSNPAPHVALPAVVPSGVRAVGNGHCQARFGPLCAVAFRAAERGVAAAIEAAAAARRPLHVAGRLELDEWGGRRRAKLCIEDIAEPC